MKSGALQLLLDFFAQPPAAPALVPAEPHYEILHSARRRTLSLEVHRDLRVVVRAPSGCPDDVITRYVTHHQRWIARQLSRFESLPEPRVPPQHAEGEPHLYLGQHYRLCLRAEARAGVTIDGDTLVVGGASAKTPRATSMALSRWYQAQARRLFPQVLTTCHHHPRFARYPLPALRIRNMRTRWGTMSRQRGMTLNTVLIQGPVECLEYVIFHELCHLSFFSHGPRFYQLMTNVLPDWEARKRLLESVITW